MQKFWICKVGRKWFNDVGTRPDEDGNNINSNDGNNINNNIVNDGKEIQTFRSNSSEIRLVRKVENVSLANVTSTTPAPPSTSSTSTTSKSTHDDYKVAGWPPEVTRNVTHYIDLDDPTSSILRPKLGPILSKSRMGESPV